MTSHSKSSGHNHLQDIRPYFYKSQIPNTKLQINPKSQYPMTETSTAAILDT